MCSDNIADVIIFPVGLAAIYYNILCVIKSKSNCVDIYRTKANEIEIQDAYI